MPDLIQIKYPHLHILDSNQLPEYIRDALYEQACQGDGLIDYCDGDFKISYSCERLRSEFSDFYKDDEDPECEKSRALRNAVRIGEYIIDGRLPEQQK